MNHALAINVGFNQAWFKNHYASQYLDSNYDMNEVERIFKLSKAAGSQTIRLWFFESSGFPMIHFEQGEMIGLKDEFIKEGISLDNIDIRSYAYGENIENEDPTLHISIFKNVKEYIHISIHLTITKLEPENTRIIHFFNE